MRRGIGGESCVSGKQRTDSNPPRKKFMRIQLRFDRVFAKNRMMQLREFSCCTSLMRAGAILLIGLLLHLPGYSAPPMASNFPGIAQTAYTPPDPVIAVGPSNVVAVV